LSSSFWRGSCSSDLGESGEELATDLRGLEKRVMQMRVPARNARALYTLKQHLNLVRERPGLPDQGRL